jgi:hypothetical protein
MKRRDLHFVQDDCGVVGMTALMVWASDRRIDWQQANPSVRVFGDTPPD